MAGKVPLVRHLAASRGCQSPTHPASPGSTTTTWPTSHDRPLVSLSCLAQIVKHPIDDVRDSAARRSLQGWSAHCTWDLYLFGRNSAERLNSTLTALARIQQCGSQPIIHRSISTQVKQGRNGVDGCWPLICLAAAT